MSERRESIPISEDIYCIGYVWQRALTKVGEQSADGSRLQTNGKVADTPHQIVSVAPPSFRDLIRGILRFLGIIPQKPAVELPPREHRPVYFSRWYRPTAIGE